MTNWSQAFAMQAGSDLDGYELLARTTLPVSRRLHYLQMWPEKLCKAYLWANSQESALHTRHNVVTKVLPAIISEHWRRIGFDKRPDMVPIRRLCREIDLLHPQVDNDGRRPDNVEYPWTGQLGQVEVPANWKFDLAAKLDSYYGRLILKAANFLTRQPAIFLG
jgi:hypothetical protein